MNRPDGNDPARDRDVRDGVARLRNRWLRVRSLHHTTQVLFYVLICGAVLLFAFPGIGVEVLALTLVSAAIVTGAVLAAVRRPSEASLAKDLDDASHLADRVSSAVELRGASGPMVDALRAEASSAAGSVEPKRVYPFALPREGWWLPVPALLLVGVVALNARLHAQEPPDPRVEETIEERLAALEELLAAEVELPSAKRKEVEAELEKLKAKLAGDDPDKKDAMAEVSKLLEQFEKEQAAEEEKKAELKKKLEQLKPGEKNRDIEESINNGDYSEALRKLREMMEELRKNQKEKKELSEEELKELEELLKKLEEIEAQLLKLMQLDADLDFRGDVIEFLEAFEGDLADIEDFEIGDVLRLADLEPPSP